MLENKNISIYIHWPYCKSLCPYCDFNSHLAGVIDHDLWLQAYIKEIDSFADTINGKYIQSIFFGGGTPSLMAPKTAEGIIRKLSTVGVMDANTEITIEANPTSYETAKFKQFKYAGINRISLGVQALNDQDLAALGRQHSAKQALKAVESASNIFARYSFDLIYCRPKQDEQAWQDELTRALEYTGDHISLYQLTIEKGTPFYSQHKQGKLILPEGDVAANMYELTADILARRGLRAYEISNYALEGMECRHNLAYWHYDEYLGIGPGAHSRLHSFDEVGTKSPEIKAVMMYHAPDKWLNSVLDKGTAIQQNNVLSTREVIEEVLMMGLRLHEGLKVDFAQAISGRNIDQIINMPAMQQYIDNGYMEYSNGNIRLTSKGLIVHNHLVPRIMNDIV